MVRFVLCGMDGWRRVNTGKLQVEGFAITSRDDDLFITSPVQEDLMAGGTSLFPPNLSHFINDMALVYLVHPKGFDEVASDCFIRLGQSEARAIAALKNHEPMWGALLAQQRVWEAALAFNLLAVGGKWRSAGSRLTWRYWKTDWVNWCDRTIQNLKETAEIADFRSGGAVLTSVRDLKTIRAAFAAGV